MSMAAVTSFDVGLRTLAECTAVVEDDAPAIKHWSVDDIVSPHSKASIKSLSSEQVARWTLAWLHAQSSRYDALHSRFGADYNIVIESQPPKGTTKLKAVQFIIFGFFGTRYPDAKVGFVSPRLKLRYDPSSGTRSFASAGTYKQNKAQAVEKATYAVEQLRLQSAAPWMHARKKDDLADALLQALQVMGITLPSPVSS